MADKFLATVCTGDISPILNGRLDTMLLTAFVAATPLPCGNAFINQSRTANGTSGSYRDRLLMACSAAIKRFAICGKFSSTYIASTFLNATVGHVTDMVAI